MRLLNLDCECDVKKIVSTKPFALFFHRNVINRVSRAINVVRLMCCAKCRVIIINRVFASVCKCEKDQRAKGDLGDGRHRSNREVMYYLLFSICRIYILRKNVVNSRTIRKFLSKKYIIIRYLL